MVAGFYRDDEETLGLIYEKFKNLKRITLNTELYFMNKLQFESI